MVGQWICVCGAESGEPVTGLEVVIFHDKSEVVV